MKINFKCCHPTPNIFPYIYCISIGFWTELVSSAEMVWSGVVGLCDLSVECPPDTSAHSAHILFWPLFLPYLDCSLLGLILFLNTWNTLNIFLNIDCFSQKGTGIDFCGIKVAWPGIGNYIKAKPHTLKTVSIQSFIKHYSKAKKAVQDYPKFGQESAVAVHVNKFWMFGLTRSISTHFLRHY